MRGSISMAVLVAAMWAMASSKVVADPPPNAAGELKSQDSALQRPAPAGKIAPSGKTDQADEPAKPNEPTAPDDAQQILNRLDQNDLAGAEQLFTGVLQREGRDSEIRALSYRMFVAQARAKNNSLALDHLLTYLDFQIDRAAQEPETASRLPGYLNLATRFGAEAERTADVLQALEQAEQRLRELDADKPHPALHQAAAQALASRVLQLAQSGREDRATQLSAASLEAAQDQLEKHPDDLRAVLATVWAMQLNAQVAESLRQPDFPDKEAAFLKFLDQQLAKQPLESALQDAYLAARFRRISRLVSTDPEHAEELRAELIEQLEDWDQNDGGTKTRVTSALRSLEQLKARLATAMKHRALIGQALPQLQVESWLNGSPLSQSDLQGKVVLLDFWAVWCGPCIATFPHLREWHEKFADRGLIIIGLTRKYGYGWNEESQSPERVPSLTPADELAGLEQFAKFHQLHHRLAVMPSEATTSAELGVSGIPQVVLVDGQGKIQMIRVGSGEQNAKDIEAMIQQLLPKPAPAADQSK